jgi:PAS domain S-box-containing protein
VHGALPEVMPERDLHESERQLRAIYESALDAFLIADDEGRYLSANPAACALLGVSEADLLGRRVADFLGPEVDFETVWHSFLEQGRMRGEIVLTLLDGSTRQVDFSAISNVLPGRHLSILRDVGDRKRAEDALQVLAEAGHLLSEALDYHVTLQSVARLAVPILADWCVLDLVSEDGELERLVTIHADPDKQALIEELKLHPPRRSEDFGTPKVLRSGRSLLMPELSPEQLDGLSRNPRHRQVIAELELRSLLIVPLVARDRTLGLWVFARSRPGSPYGDADVQLAETLARRAALAIDNSRLYREAEAANQAKDRFLAMLSHELRTPLTPVLALVSRLERSPELSAEELRRNLAVIRKNVELEARLIDDLLDLTRITRGRIELQRQVTLLHPLLEQAIQICCADAMAAGRLRVEIDLRAPEPRVWADGPRLLQVFWNLLSNAVKFTPPGGTIRVSTAIDGEDGRIAVVEISDTGIGIEPDLLPRIFEPFEQGLGTAQQFGGLGLGLAIGKAILDAQGGSLAASSAGRGRGATFVMRVPLYEGPAEEARTPPRLEEPEHPRFILLVEDHGDTAEVMAELLREHGHRVVVAGSQAAALAAAADSGIDLVISDLGLPDGSGLTLMRELQDRHGLTGIAVSGYGTEEDRRQSLAAGFSAHLTKPLTIDRLLDEIRRMEPHGGR